MAEYSKLFQRVTTSAELLVLDESSSQEIRYSATQLQAKIKPCLDELQQSARELKALLEPCFTELQDAEATWESKTAIAAASSIEIREHLGHLAGYLFKLRLLKSQLHSQASEQIKQSWRVRLEQLKEIWFIDSKSGSLKSVNAPEKEKFIQALRCECDRLSNDLDLALAEFLTRLLQDLRHIQLDKTIDYINLLDNQEKSRNRSLLEILNSTVLQQMSQSPNHLAGGTQRFFSLNPLIDRLINQSLLISNLLGKSLIGYGFLPITWDLFSKFNQEVQDAIESTIGIEIDDKANLVIALLEKMIQFYDNFLEKQQRYQQESLNQRASEKLWLSARRQDLEQVRKDVELVLNPFGQSH
jgi:hypothetical protein